MLRRIIGILLFFGTVSSVAAASSLCAPDENGTVHLATRGFLVVSNTVTVANSTENSNGILAQTALIAYDDVAQESNISYWRAQMEVFSTSDGGTVKVRAEQSRVSGQQFGDNVVVYSADSILSDPLAEPKVITDKYTYQYHNYGSLTMCNVIQTGFNYGFFKNTTMLRCILDQEIPKSILVAEINGVCSLLMSYFTYSYSGVLYSNLGIVTPVVPLQSAAFAPWADLLMYPQTLDTATDHAVMRRDLVRLHTDAAVPLPAHPLRNHYTAQFHLGGEVYH